MTATERKIAKGYKEDYCRYRDAVLSGKKISSVDETNKVERQERDLREGVSGYHWDEDEAVKPLVWMALNMVFPIGEKAGEPFILSPWQVYDTMCLFGWINDKGNRRFNQAYIEVPRKNGKSTWMGGVIAYAAFGEKDGVRCYIAATNLDQAEETFMRAGEGLKKAGGHDGLQVANSKNNKVITWGNSQIRAITGEPKDGKLAYFTIIDEYHQHKDNKLIDSIRSGNVGDQQAMLVRITTAGTEVNSVCHEEFKKCEKILSGEIDNDGYFVSIYHADEGDPYTEVSTWYKANPNLGYSVDIAKFSKLFDDAKCSESDTVTFKTKNLNMWTRGVQRWCNMPLWEEKCRWFVPEDELKGKECYCGLDLSSVYDFTAFTADFPIAEGAHVQLTHFWIAENQMEAIARQCRIPLRQWMADGYITATPGNVIDYAYVVDYLEDFRSHYGIMWIAVDQWHINQLEAIMPEWFLDVEYECSQGMKNMSAITTKFERAYRQGEVTANRNPVMDWMMSCADVKMDSADNVKLVKADKWASRIDGVITSIMAYDNAVSHINEEKPINVDSWMAW